MQERQELFLFEQHQAVHAQRIRMEKEAAEAQYWCRKTHLLDAKGIRNGLPGLIDPVVPPVVVPPINKEERRMLGDNRYGQKCCCNSCKSLILISTPYIVKWVIRKCFL